MMKKKKKKVCVALQLVGDKQKNKGAGQKKLTIDNNPI
jgi:hypothetical protein